MEFGIISLFRKCLIKFQTKHSETTWCFWSWRQPYDISKLLLKSKGGKTEEWIWILFSRKGLVRPSITCTEVTDFHSGYTWRCWYIECRICWRHPDGSPVSSAGGTFMGRHCAGRGSLLAKVEKRWTPNQDIFQMMENQVLWRNMSLASKCRND